MFVFNSSGQNAIINTLSVNSEGVFFSGGDNGTLTLWAWNMDTVSAKTRTTFLSPVLWRAEARVFYSIFDMDRYKVDHY